jgi:hypothetical protein
MISRIKRLVWSLGVTLSMGVAFVPLGCESSGRYTSVYPTNGGPELPGRVVEGLTDCVNQAPAPSTSAEGDPPTYAIQFDVHVAEDGGVSSVEVRDSMLGGGGMEGCLAGVLRGARLPVRAQATQRAPQSRALVAAAPALAALGPISLVPVVITGVGLIVLVAVTVYIASEATDEDREKERCKKVKRMCIDKCTDDELPTHKNDGMPYHKCLRECLEADGCWGKTN